MTTDRSRPAAYVRATSGHGADMARHRDAVAEGARQRGWPAPTVYAEDEADLADGRAPALSSLEAAIEVGRHDALLITEPGAVTGTATHLMSLLYRCTRHGVVVGFLLPPAPPGAQAMTPRPSAEHAAAFPLAREAWGVLARARIEALSELFPGWRIWLDRAGWHARRRDNFLETRAVGDPSFSVHADTPTDLTAQLLWQQAADHRAADAPPAAQPRRTRR